MVPPSNQSEATGGALFWTATSRATSRVLASVASQWMLWSAFYFSLGLGVKLVLYWSPGGVTMWRRSRKCIRRCAVPHCRCRRILTYKMFVCEVRQFTCVSWLHFAREANRLYWLWRGIVITSSAAQSIAEFTVDSLQKANIVTHFLGFYSVFFINKYSLSLAFVLSGFSLRMIWAIDVTSFSFVMSEFFDLNFWMRSLMVIGLRMRYLLTASSVIPSLKQSSIVTSSNYIMFEVILEADIQSKNGTWSLLSYISMQSYQLA